jgi:putative ABC transport system permease protein
VRALQRKLLRDLWQIKGQAVAISLVIAAGIAMYISYSSTFRSLDLTKEAYYDRYRFADVFASLKRAPLYLGERIAAIPGVARAETRVVVAVTLDLEEVAEPLIGQLISIPERQTAILNDIAIRSGRYIEGDHPDEVLVSEGFALANKLLPGDTVTAVINGRRRDLVIVGTALSPEYTYTIRPGELFPDESRYGIFWMGRKALASAFDMEGGFNDVVLKLMPNSSSQDVIQRLDRLLEPYGGLGAIPREFQISNWSLSAELEGLKGMGVIMPMIFLSVAAFLLNVVLTRIVAVQRTQIAALKALGYTQFEIAVHYTEWSLVVSLLGALFGIVGGAGMGSGMISLYNNYFRFPFLEYRLEGSVILTAVMISVVAALLGAWTAVRKAARLPPAEAMQPEPPASFKESWVEKLGLKQLLSQPSRMILRNVQRRPGRTLASVVGISFAVAMLIVGLFFIDSIDELMDIQFNVIDRQDITLTFVEPASASALHELASLPGVISTEKSRVVAARLVHGHRSRQSAVTGIGPDVRLHRVMDSSLAEVKLPPEGLVLSTKLASILAAKPGDTVTVQVLEGARPRRQVRVTGLVEEYLGTSAYMDAGALHRLLREGENLSGAYLQIDANAADKLYTRLKAVPAVAGVALKSAALASFKKTMDESMGIMVTFSVLFASIIAFGVVYNAARISLSERSRELASLRVIGLTRGEISFILLGELALLTLAALPLGSFLGYSLAWLTCAAYDTELYRFPLVVSTRTYGYSILTVLLAAVISGLVVRRRLDQLDLVEVLKTRE